MNVIAENWFLSILILFGTFGLVSASLWIGGRLAPWFLQAPYAAPPVLSYFTDFDSDLSFDRARMTVGAIALAVTLFAILSIGIVARLLGLAV